MIGHRSCQSVTENFHEVLVLSGVSVRDANEGGVVVLASTWLALSLNFDPEEFPFLRQVSIVCPFQLQKSHTRC